MPGSCGASVLILSRSLSSADRRPLHLVIPRCEVLVHKWAFQKRGLQDGEMAQQEKVLTKSDALILTLRPQGKKT